MIFILFNTFSHNSSRSRYHHHYSPFLVHHHYSPCLLLFPFLFLLYSFRLHLFMHLSHAKLVRQLFFVKLKDTYSLYIHHHHHYSGNMFHISCSICSLIRMLCSLNKGWSECDVCNVLCLTPARLPSSVKPTVEALVTAQDSTRYGRRLGHPGLPGEGGAGQQEDGEDHLESELSIIFITPADLSIMKYKLSYLEKHHSVSAPLWTPDSLLGVSGDMIYCMIYF